MTLYPDEHKRSLIERMLPPQNADIPPLFRETGIPKDTVYGWRRQAPRARGIAPVAHTAERWSSEEQFARVVETAALSEAERGEYCRQRGRYPEPLQAWRRAGEQANAGQTAPRPKPEAQADQRRIQELERALSRKEKALAEAAARLVLRKKAEASLKAGRGRMISTPDRQQAVELINAARQSGARLKPACQELGIDVGTDQRWTRDGGIKTDGRPQAERPTPANKLSAKERAQVLAICHEPAYVSRPPSQIVPRLADEGRSIASASSCYRILCEADEQHHRGRRRPPRPAGEPPRLCTKAPGEVWTWDSSGLPGPVKGLFFYRYLIVDLYSRKIVGWEVYERESADHAAEVVRRAVLAEGCIDQPLVLPADNGSPMKGETWLATRYRLGISTSYSRPRTRNDNPYAEALFRTGK